MAGSLELMGMSTVLDWLEFPAWMQDMIFGAETAPIQDVHKTLFSNLFGAYHRTH